jgi:hypothetical protein
MNKFDFESCPVCQGELYVSRQVCKNCKAEFPVEKTISKFDLLTGEQKEFLEAFLKNRGNIKIIGEELKISYPTVKKRLDDLLKKLGYAEEQEKLCEVKLDMNTFGEIDYNSTIPSEIIRRKIYENGGSIVISLLDGKQCRVIASVDGKSFTSDKLNNYKLSLNYSVFNDIVDLLKSSQQYRAPKGNGHGKEDKVGYGKCTEDTIVGTVAVNYFKKKYGESTYDPTFVLAAMLDWAGIGINQRGFVSLNPNYISKL